MTIALTGANDSTSTTGDILIKTGGTLAAYTCSKVSFDEADLSDSLDLVTSSSVVQVVSPE